MFRTTNRAWLALCVAMLAGVAGCGPTITPAPSRGFAASTPIPVVAGRPAQVSPTAAVNVVRYISADGDGAFIRSKPDREAKVKVWPDGTAMTVIAEQPGWAQVRAPDGYVGYVPAEYLTGVRPGQAPVAQPAAQATIAPAPVSAGLTAAEKKYAEWGASAAELLGSSSSRMEELVGDPNPASTSWRDAMALQMSIWRLLYEEAKAITAPPRFIPVHQPFTAGLAHYATAADLMDRGLATLDGALVRMASTEIQLGASDIRTARSVLTSLTR